MKKLIIILAVLVGIAAVWFFFLRGSTVEMQWGGASWPESVRGVGEATEQVAHEGRGKAQEADRARARERARWKAYYYAQLRLAEQLGGLKIDAETTVHDAVLVDQEVKAAYSGTIRAAAEVESESTITNLPDAVQARVVVEAPRQRVMTLREAVVHALKGGKISLKLAGRRAARPTEVPRQTPAASEQTEKTQNQTGSAEDAASASAPVATAGAPRAHQSRRRQKPSYTGCVITLPPSPDALVAAPDFYDAAGVFLGSVLDLPAKVRTAGLPVADPGDTHSIQKVAGKHPVKIEGTVTAGNIILTRKLTPEEAKLFTGAIRANRVILVLGEEAN